MKKKINDSRIAQTSWLLNKYIAHRGVSNENIPENSISSFKNAIELGYAIEFDVQMIEDGTIIVFHDNKLSRMLGKDKYVSTLTLEEFKSLKFSNGESIPTLGQALKAINGKTPILIEIKNSLKVGELEKNVYELLKKYKGEYAIQSFNPYTLGWFANNAPDILRGQLSSYFKGENLSFVKKVILKKLRCNKISKPDFISYDCRNLPNRYVKRCKKPVLAWTVTSQEEYMRLAPFCDNIIFDGFFPEI